METVFWVLLFVVVLGWIIPYPPDNSDKGWFNRSGLIIYTDSKTKIQYIKGGYFGGITPRLDTTGKPMRSEE